MHFVRKSAVLGIAWQKRRQTGEKDMGWVTSEATRPTCPQDLAIHVGDGTNENTKAI